VSPCRRPLGGVGFIFAAPVGAAEPVWKTAPVDNERAQLSSATTTLEELVARVSETAESAQAAGDETLAADLFEVERSLRIAYRRLNAVTRRVR
jgi:hypothetical protein